MAGIDCITRRETRVLIDVAVRLGKPVYICGNA